MKAMSAMTDELYAAIMSLETVGEAKRFFRDLLTDEEIEEFSRRWHAVKLLDRNTPYLEIQKDTGLSSATVARISKWLKKGAGGYALVLERLAQHATREMYE